jgi:hypothetical protein
LDHSIADDDVAEHDFAVAVGAKGTMPQIPTTSASLMLGKLTRKDTVLETAECRDPRPAREAQGPSPPQGFAQAPTLTCSAPNCRGRTRHCLRNGESRRLGRLSVRHQVACNYADSHKNTAMAAGTTIHDLIEEQNLL